MALDGDGALLGTCGVFPLDARTWELRKMYLHGRSRGRGVGRRLLDAARIGRMRPGAVLVNIGRGALVDQDAMIAALESGALGGAVLDVTDPEPLPAGHGLWRTPNVILTPHISGQSPTMLDNVMEIFAENLRRYAGGAPLMNIVQRELGY